MIVNNFIPEYRMTGLRLKDLQFFAKKKDEEEDEDNEDIIEDEEEEEEKPKPKRKPKSKSEEDRPSWVNELLEAIKPKEQANNGTQKVPVPPIPKMKETEDEDNIPPEPKKKQSFLRWFL